MSPILANHESNPFRIRAGPEDEDLGNGGDKKSLRCFSMRGAGDMALQAPNFPGCYLFQIFRLECPCIWHIRCSDLWFWKFGHYQHRESKWLGKCQKPFLLPGQPLHTFYDSGVSVPLFLLICRFGVPPWTFQTLKSPLSFNDDQSPAMWPHTPHTLSYSCRGKHPN